MILKFNRNEKRQADLHQLGIMISTDIMCFL